MNCRRHEAASRSDCALVSVSKNTFVQADGWTHLLCVYVLDAERSRADYCNSTPYIQYRYERFYSVKVTLSTPAGVPSDVTVSMSRDGHRPMTSCLLYMYAIRRYWRISAFCYTFTSVFCKRNRSTYSARPTSWASTRRFPVVVLRFRGSVKAVCSRISSLLGWDRRNGLEIDGRRCWSAAWSEWAVMLMLESTYGRLLGYSDVRWTTVAATGCQCVSVEYMIVLIHREASDWLWQWSWTPWIWLSPWSRNAVWQGQRVLLKRKSFGGKMKSPKRKFVFACPVKFVTYSQHA